MQPQHNPEALEDAKQVYRDPVHNATIVKQDTPGGGTVVQTTGRRPEDRPDEESHPGMYTSTAGTTAGSVYTAPTTVRPSPRAGDQVKPNHNGEGFLGGIFTTKSSSRFFFSLHSAIVFFSFLVFISSALAEDRGLAVNRFTEYQMTTAQVSFAVSLGALVMERLGLLENRHLRVALSAFQVFFWVPALVIMTFFGSFVSPLTAANGFFGAWGALAAAAIVFMHESERTRRDPRRSSAPRASLLLMFFFSLMVMGSGILLYNRYDDTPQGFNNPEDPFSYTVFAIAFGAITAALSVIMLLVLDTTAAATLAVFGTILWLWVIVGVLVLTFAEPFEAALGNGYYSALFTLLASFGLFQALHRANDPASSNHQHHLRGRGSSAPPTATTATTRVVDLKASRAFFSHIRVMTIAGLVVLVAGALICRVSCGTGMLRFQVAAGAVPLFFGLIVSAMEMFGLYRISSWPKIVFAFVMLLWWIGVFTVLTYFGSFQSPTGTNAQGQQQTSATYANGYFFTWVGLIFSCLAFAEALKENAHENRDAPNPAIAKSGFLLLVILGSIITMGMGIHDYYGTGWQQSPSLTIFAIALGACSIFLCLVTYCVMGGTANKSHDVHDSLYNGFLYLLTVWWAIGALVLTFMNFWSGASNNGYFAVFFTLGACLLALSGIWRHEDDDDDDYYVETPTTNTNVPPAATAPPTGAGHQGATLYTQAPNTNARGY